MRQATPDCRGDKESPLDGATHTRYTLVSRYRIRNLTHVRLPTHTDLLKLTPGAKAYSTTRPDFEDNKLRNALDTTRFVVRLVKRVEP
jgi:hypothetical protein